MRVLLFFLMVFMAAAIADNEKVKVKVKDVGVFDVPKDVHESFISEKRQLASAVKSCTPGTSQYKNPLSTMGFSYQINPRSGGQCVLVFHASHHRYHCRLNRASLTRLSEQISSMADDSTVYGDFVGLLSSVFFDDRVCAYSKL